MISDMANGIVYLRNKYIEALGMEPLDDEEAIAVKDTTLKLTDEALTTMIGKFWENEKALLVKEHKKKY